MYVLGRRGEEPETLAKTVVEEPTSAAEEPAPANWGFGGRPGTLADIEAAVAGEMVVAPDAEGFGGMSDSVGVALAYIRTP
jgi:hypothetical protein